MEKTNALIDESVSMAIDIVRCYQWLCSEKKEYVLAKQLLRSGTSIGANIHEANYAISRADFISKMQIALKEAAETEYWLLILHKTGYLGERYAPLQERCLTLKRMLVSTLNTAKKPRP